MAMPVIAPVKMSLRSGIPDPYILGWHDDPLAGMCRGYYTPLPVQPLVDQAAMQVMADNVSLYPSGRSKLNGHVQVKQRDRQVTANTAHIDHDESHVTRISLLGDVIFQEPGRLMFARKAVINAGDRSGYIEQAQYRIATQQAGAVLPASGVARWIERLKDQTLLLRDVTYTTCSPANPAWYIGAEKITLNKDTGTAKNAGLHLGKLPVLHVPYLSFPTSKARKSGFLIPITGYSNVGGFDLAMPYYMNLAADHDLTLMPHAYTLRGMMLGGDFRFLTDHSTGVISGNILPDDVAFEQFLVTHRDNYPDLKGVANNRWSFSLREHTQFSPNLNMNINYQQVSDAYYLQDFSSNLAVLTENQLLRQGDLSYTTDHWLFHGLLQNYQTLHPINQSEIANIYARLPQLSANGSYTELPFNGQLSLLGEMDYFRWTSSTQPMPEGARYTFNPILAFPQRKPYGYITPEIQWVANDYSLTGPQFLTNTSFKTSVPRYSLDSGLAFERPIVAWGDRYLQTLEPRLFYLNVPYQDQSQIPAFESAYMIFSTDQLFRTNRFSGLDRIGDANQLAYAVTSRWIAGASGREKASVTVGQLRYFSPRRVQLCTSKNGQCTDSSLFLGYISNTAQTSPIAGQAVYELSSAWRVRGDYVWDTSTHATNNGDLNLHYQPASNKVLTVGYNYLVNANLIDMPHNYFQNAALHQATFSSAWPLAEQWSGIGVYSYNISKGYGMMTFLGLQYDTCCWAARILGGSTFKSLTPVTMTPQYNNNVYVQLLLKGLGTVANSDPSSILQSYLPGYTTVF